MSEHRTSKEMVSRVEELIRRAVDEGRKMRDANSVSTGTLHARNEVFHLFDRLTARVAELEARPTGCPVHGECPVCKAQKWLGDPRVGVSSGPLVTEQPVETFAAPVLHNFPPDSDFDTGPMNKALDEKLKGNE